MKAKAQKLDVVKNEPEENKEAATVTPLVVGDKECSSTPSVGESLRKKRISLKRELIDVSRTLRISEGYLKAIEEDRGDDLPERVYAIGFVRSYSQFLGLDASILTRRFCEEVLATHQKKTYNLPISYSPKNTPSRGVFKLCLWLSIALIGGWLVFEGRLSDLFSGGGIPSSLEKVPSESEVASVSQAPSLREQESPASLTEERPLTNDVEKDIPEIDEEIEDYARALRANEGLHQQEGREKTVSSQEAGAQPYQLVFSGQSWVEIRQESDGKILVNKVFKKGESFTLPQDLGRLVMKVGNGAAVRVFNGQQESRPLGKDGQVVANVPLDSAGLKPFLDSSL